MCMAVWIGMLQLFWGKQTRPIAVLIHGRRKHLRLSMYMPRSRTCLSVNDNWGLSQLSICPWGVASPEGMTVHRSFLYPTHRDITRKATKRPSGYTKVLESFYSYPRAKPVSECDGPEERRLGAFAICFQGGTPCRRRHYLTIEGNT